MIDAIIKELYKDGEVTVYKSEHFRLADNSKYYSILAKDNSTQYISNQLRLFEDYVGRKGWKPLDTQ